MSKFKVKEDLPMTESLLEILACPFCKSHVVPSKEESVLECPGCQRKYQVLNGVPIFVSGEFLLKQREDQTEKRSLKIRLYHALPSYARPFVKTLYRSVLPPTRPLWFDKSMFTFVESLPAGSKVLNLGSGYARLNVESSVNLDIILFPDVDVVGDGHQLPFIKESFDCVLCSAVLEHVAQPHKVAKEIRRVLRKRGYACINTPFLETVHKKVDYFRFTLDGLRILFGDFKEIKSGISAGPSQTVADIIRGYVPSFFYGTPLCAPLEFVMGWLVLPIRWIDLFFRKKRNVRYLLDRSYYFVGQKE